MNALGGVMYDLLQEAVLERCEAGRRRCFLSRLRTGTALAGLSLACVVPMGDAARAAPDVTIDNTVTVPILMVLPQYCRGTVTVPQPTTVPPQYRHAHSQGLDPYMIIRLTDGSSRE